MKSASFETIQDLHTVVRRLNTHVKELNAVIEQGDATYAHHLAESIRRDAIIVANEIEYQSLFNNEEYVQWTKEAA